MRKLLIALLLLGSVSVLAQDKFKPVIRKGSKLHYILHVNGQAMPMDIVVDSLSGDYTKLGWTLEGMGNGSWVMKKKSLESASSGYWNQPTAGTEEVLADDMAVLLLSKAQWNGLTNDKKFSYSGGMFTVKSEGGTPITIGGKTLDAIQADGGNTKLWILNSADFPVLLKVEGNPFEIDMDIASIE